MLDPSVLQEQDVLDRAAVLSHEELLCVVTKRTCKWKIAICLEFALGLLMVFAVFIVVTSQEKSPGVIDVDILNNLKSSNIIVMPFNWISRHSNVLKNIHEREDQENVAIDVELKKTSCRVEAWKRCDGSCFNATCLLQVHRENRAEVERLPDSFDAQPDLLFQLVKMLNPSVLQVHIFFAHGSSKAVLVCENLQLLIFLLYCSIGENVQMPYLNDAYTSALKEAVQEVLKWIQLGRSCKRLSFKIELWGSHLNSEMERVKMEDVNDLLNAIPTLCDEHGDMKLKVNYISLNRNIELQLLEVPKFLDFVRQYELCQSRCSEMLRGSITPKDLLMSGLCVDFLKEVEMLLEDHHVIFSSPPFPFRSDDAKRDLNEWKDAMHVEKPGELTSVIRNSLPDMFDAQPDLLFQLVTMLNPSVLART
ncbi:hypothetical protein L6452_11664 [Arctium lappa]|uniref:Uncharacterized protein n=1 Tax=Arctium lappa TaxID=4217 RepID=A0ACB9DPR0_ARCLA|nr:hypothetical protein L6452_11664 [Arctium lappa]